MNKDKYLDLINKNFNDKKLLIDQVVLFYNASSINYTKYDIGDDVFLKKNTLLHGTYKNIDGLKEIVDNGLVASFFTGGRISKYPCCVGVWNIKNDILLKDYINFYSGGTIKYMGLLINKEYSQEIKTSIIPYSDMNSINDILKNNPSRIWNMEQTKEARFMPSLAQDQVQIGIIFNGDNKYTKELLKKDILEPNFINDIDVKPFVNENYYDKFIIDRKNKDDFFTDRESAILFGIPSNLIEGILVGRDYEKDSNVLNEIKQLLPECYICNLDGKVIVDNK